MEQQPNQTNEFQSPTPESLYQLFTLQQEFLDQHHGDLQFVVERGNGPETIFVTDYVITLNQNGSSEGERSPVVMFKTSEDSNVIDKTNIETFVSWRGLDQDGVQDEIDTLAAEEALVEPAKEKEVVDETISPETRDNFTERQKVIFVPIQEDEEKLDYSELFGERTRTPEEEKERYEAYLKEAKIKEQTGYKITPESEADAVEQIRSIMVIDKPLAELLEIFLKSTGGSIDSLPKALRSNPELRLAAGSYLQSKVERHAHEMPRRVRVNTEKASNSAPDFKYSLYSQEVAAKYALAMLDGTFLRSREDAVFYDEASGQGVGQHRIAARIVLSRRAD
jgi:hypothetical protein